METKKVESKTPNLKTEKSGIKKNLSWKKAVHAVAATSSKINSFTITMRSLRTMAEKEAKLVQCALKDMENNLIDPKHILELTKSINDTGEKSISEYINRNTEILLNEHSSVIRQQVIEKMKQQMKEMSDELVQDSKKLETNTSNFFELIESSYHSASESFHNVVRLAKENYEKEAEIGKTKDELLALQSEVQKSEDKLLECLMCYAFMDSLVPDAQEGKKLDLPSDFLESFGPSYSHEKRIEMHRKVLDDLISSNESFGPLKIHLESADAIVRVIERLKDSNFSLVRNSHLSRGTLQYERRELAQTKEKMEGELQIYEEKIATVEDEIEKALEMQEKLKKQLREIEEDESAKEVLLQREEERKKLAELYNLCTGSDSRNLDIYLMKSAIDFCLEDIFNELNKHPRRKIREMLKVLEAKKKWAERKQAEARRAERLLKRQEMNARAPGRRIIL